MVFNNSVNASQAGFQSITTGGVWNGRTLTSSDGSISITNSDGTVGNPDLKVNGGAPYISLSPFIVGTDVHSGYSTIQAAITAAVNAGATASNAMNVYIKPKVDGTPYTEDLILQPGVNLIGFGYNPTIIGKLTYTQAGSVSIQGVTLQTNGDFFLAITGSAASQVFVSNCNLTCSNNTGISFTSSSGSSLIQVLNCSGDITTTGIAMFSMSSIGVLNIFYSIWNNSGLSSTASTSSAGAVQFFNCVNIRSPISLSSTNTSKSINNYIEMATNSVAITTAGTGTHAVQGCRIASGTASAVSIGAGTIVNIINTEINSSNANVLTGAGTLKYAFLSFSGSSSGHNVTTESPFATLI